MSDGSPHPSVARARAVLDAHTAGSMYGVSPHRYHVKARIEHSHLTRWFKRVLGVTPAAYVAKITAGTARP